MITFSPLNSFSLLFLSVIVSFVLILHLLLTFSLTFW